MTYAVDAKTTARESIEKAGDVAAKAARSAGHDVSLAVENAADMAHHQLDAMAGYVRRNPLQSTAIAAALGFVVALIARR